MLATGQRARPLVATRMAHVGRYTVHTRPPVTAFGFAINCCVGAVLYTFPLYPTHPVDCKEQRVRCEYVFGG